MTRFRIRVAAVIVVTGFAVACRARSAQPPPVAAATPPPVAVPDACTLALAPDGGAEKSAEKNPEKNTEKNVARGGPSKTDEAIARLQQTALQHPQPAHRAAAVNELGQYFISKARATRDYGYYQRAEASARCAEALEPGNQQALLLRGHLLHQEHRFKEAEQLARQLVSRRGLFLDYGLLGDALMEQGKVDEAGEAYQHMMDLKPFYQSYTRAAHLRWLKGDLPGAIGLMRLAIKAASPRDPESIAWAYSRLAIYQLQAGRPYDALESCQSALTFQPAYPPALLARGRVLLAQKRAAEAVSALQEAVKGDAAPDYQWTLADAFRAAGRADEARAIDASIQQTGTVTDPRTFALYLATRGEQVDLAVTLARREMDTRSDVFTLDALGWSLAASGQAAEADAVMKRALARGTVDARLFYHAGVIAATRGDETRARQWLRKARALQQMLLPSEQAHVARAWAHMRISNPRQESTTS